MPMTAVMTQMVVATKATSNLQIVVDSAVWR